VDDLAEDLYKNGKIKDKCESADFYHRLKLLEVQFPGLSVLLHRQGILSSPAQNVWTHKSLLGVAKQLLGPNISGHPAWNLRTKTPHESQGDVPWHQDSAYFDSDGDKTLILTAWVPLIDANVENGCMQVMKGGHKTGNIAPHTGCSGQTWHIEAVTNELPSFLGVSCDSDIVTVPTTMGSVLFLNNLIPHRSLPNLSDKIRWSFDFRYHKTGEPAGYSMKPSIILSKQDDPNYTIEWENWAKIDRTSLQAGKAEDKFETRIVGPWMERWPLTNHNRHTDYWQELKHSTTQDERNSLQFKY